MSIERIVATGAFEPTTDPVELARTHARFELMTGDRVERELLAAIRAERPCAAEVKGPTGAGKSSSIMRVVSDVARLTGPPTYEILMLRAGEAQQFLGDPGELAKHVLALIKAQGYRFATEVQEELANAGADETTVTDPVTSHAAGLKAGPQVVQASYQASLQDAYEQRTYGQDPARARLELEDVLTIIRDSGVVPMIVVDDTDRFADPAPGGLNAEAVNDLFNNGVRLLAEIGFPFVVAVHPRFEETEAYGYVADKHLHTRLGIPWLGLETGAIEAILEKHLRAHEVEVEVRDVIDPVALSALWGVYAGGRRDIRLVMRAVGRAANLALDRGSERIEVTDVSSALESVARS